MTSCKCGQSYLENSWWKNKCCNFFITKYEGIPSDYYLFFNDNIYWIDNDSCALFQIKGNHNLNFRIEMPKIDEELPTEEIINKIINFINNLCFY